MHPDRLASFLAHRIEDDRVLAQLLARLGECGSVEVGAGCDGEGHFAPLEVLVDRPMRLYARVEPIDSTGCLQAARFALGPPDADPHGPGWLPILDVVPDQVDTWVASRRFGAWTRGEGRQLGYQGWWRHDTGLGAADLSTRVLVHARHRRGSLLWIASRMRRDAPGEVHKHTLAVLVDADD